MAHALHLVVVALHGEKPVILKAYFGAGIRSLEASAKRGHERTKLGGGNGWSFSIDGSWFHFRGRSPAGHCRGRCSVLGRRGRTRRCFARDATLAPRSVEAVRGAKRAHHRRGGGAAPGRRPA